MNDEWMQICIPHSYFRIPTSSFPPPVRGRCRRDERRTCRHAPARSRTKNGSAPRRTRPAEDLSASTVVISSGSAGLISTEKFCRSGFTLTASRMIRWANGPT